MSHRPSVSFIDYASPLPPPGGKPKPKPRPKPAGPVTTMAVGEEEGQAFRAP